MKSKLFVPASRPELFEKAKTYEKVDHLTGERYTWQRGESLVELSRPERIKEIQQRHPLRVLGDVRTLAHILADPDDPAEDACLICDV